jgi:hypothetical protein
MALLGIRNEQEFYSDYYLEAIFRGDLKEVQARWKQPAERIPLRCHRIGPWRACGAIG